MSRNGAVEENVSRGTTKNVSGRIAKITFEKETAPGSDLEWGRGAKTSGGEKRKHKGYGAHSSEAYLDSLLAQVGVETATYKTDSIDGSKVFLGDGVDSRYETHPVLGSIDDSGVRHTVAAHVLDTSSDLKGKYEPSDSQDMEQVYSDESLEILHEHRSSISQESVSSTTEKLSEKTAYKSRIKKEAVKKSQARKDSTLKFDDEIVLGEKSSTASIVTGIKGAVSELNSKEIIRKKLKNKQRRELITYGGVASKISDSASTAVHQKVHENEDDNASVEVTHETEIAVENTIRRVGAKLKQEPSKRKSRLKFDDAVDVVESKAEADIATGKGSEKLKEVIEDHAKLKEKSKLLKAYKNSSSKAGKSKSLENAKKSDANKKIQKKKIKQSYAEAFRGKGTGISKLVDGTKDAVKGGLVKTGAVIADFVKKNYGAVIALVCVGVLFLIILAGSGTIVTMISQAGSSFVESTYSSTDDDIINNDESYVEMENELQDQIDNIESTYSGYDEYRYQVDEISHDPYALASYFTAKYGNYKAADVNAELLPLFQEQYILTLTEEVEIKTRTVTNPDTGEESEEEYEWYVLNVKLENKGVDVIARANLTDKQLMLYNAYQATKGNRSYLFGEHPIAGNVSGGGLSYDIPQEALEDEAFARMIEEAENYLGRAYVWGGSSPSTGFDCSGFVSWVINHSGNGWNVGRQTANGLMNHCTYVSSADAKPGDLIFFEKTYNTTGASHVGIYVGDGMMIHCGNPIQYTSIESNYWRQHFLSFGRIN